MRPPDVRRVDHEVPQALILPAPVVLRPHGLHHHTVLLVIVPQEGVPLEVEHCVHVFVSEFLGEVQEEELESNVVGVLQGICH